MREHSSEKAFVVLRVGEAQPVAVDTRPHESFASRSVNARFTNMIMGPGDSTSDDVITQAFRPFNTP